MRLVALFCITVLACGQSNKPRHDDVVTLDRDTTPVRLPPRVRPGPLTQADRDSLLREVATRREAWRARHITDYRIQIAVGCFCPWPGNPAILEVRNGTAVALWDTAGKPMGVVREPWSLYTVEKLFDAAERSARSHDVVEVGYDARYDYPARIRGDARLGLPDDWFTISASRLTLLR